MTIDVSLMSAGHLDIGEIRSFLQNASDRPAEVIRDFWVLETHHFVIAFKDPHDRRHSRELRIHHSFGVDSEQEAANYIGADIEYTYMVLGEHGNGPKIMRDLAERFGGYFQNDANPEQDEYYDVNGPIMKPR